MAGGEEMQGKKVLVFGLGFFQRELLLSLSKTRVCTVVDTDASLLSRFRDETPNTEIIEGEASSIVTWKKINTSDISHIISAVQDYDVVLEICRITREVYSLDIPLIILWYRNGAAVTEFEKYGAKVLNPMSIGVEAVESLVNKNYSKPSNIGLGQGEIVEVSILRRSHIVERKMRYLQPSRWKVAAAYRDGKLIIPDGDFKLQIGDRALLIGEPKVIENIVNILMKGTPEFPLQYGQTFAVLADKLSDRDIFELHSFCTKTRARKFLYYKADNVKHQPKEEMKMLEDHGCKRGSDLKYFRGAAYLKDIGILALSGTDKFSIFNLRMRYFFRKASSPLLICRGVFPYSEILISFNGHIPDRLLEIGSEIAVLLGVPFRVVFVTPPGALKTKADEEEAKARQNIITDFENLNRSKVAYSLLEGNPVHETLNLINGKKDILLVVSSNSGEPISVLSPHVPYLLAARSGVSVLVLPDENGND